MVYFQIFASAFEEELDVANKISFFKYDSLLNELVDRDNVKNIATPVNHGCH